jgi:hypothetical protein
MARSADPPVVITFDHHHRRTSSNGHRSGTGPMVLGLADGESVDDGRIDAGGGTAYATGSARG